VRGFLGLAILVALTAASTPLFWQPIQAVEPKSASYDGKVVLVKDLLEKSKIKLDRDAAPLMVAFVVEGKAYPIIKDDGGRRFFKDENLLNKEYRINGRIIGGTMFQVLSVQSLKDGKPHDIYYWCDICAIRRNEKNACECCGGPMELREELVGK
jgi:hypothetical protein